MFVIASVISVVYCIVSFLEMRFFQKESKPLKMLLRDTLLVYVSVVIALFVLEQIQPVLSVGGSLMAPADPKVFVGEPGF